MTIMKHNMYRPWRQVDHAARIVVAALLLLAVIASAQTAVGQRVQRIVATVNEEIVSEYDLLERLEVVIRTSGLRPTPQLRRRLSQQVLRSLVDERLKLQEAKRRNITVTDRNLRAAIGSIEKQNGIPAGSFDTFVQKVGVPREALIKQLRAQITWQKYVGRVLLPRVTVGEDEIDEILEHLKNRKGQTEYLVSEILLPVDQPEQENEVRRTAQRLLEELKKGASFAAVARQFSQAPSASVGGDLGWIPEATMNEELRRIVSGMDKGEIVGPIRTLAGIQIFRLDNERKILTGSSDDTVVDLQQILLPAAGGQSQDAIKGQMRLAQTMRDTLSGCSDHLRAAREVNSIGKTKIGKVRLGNLTKPVRSAIDNLPVGKPSVPVRTAAGISILMVCDRKEAADGLPSRKQITDRLREERVGVLARRLLRDLRARAIVDLRV